MSSVNKALQHVLSVVIGKLSEFHKAQDEYDAKYHDSSCLPEEPCRYCELQTATLLAIAAVWEHEPKPDVFDPHDETPHHNS